MAIKAIFFDALEIKDCIWGISLFIEASHLCLKNLFFYKTEFLSYMSEVSRSEEELTEPVQMHRKFL